MSSPGTMKYHPHPFTLFLTRLTPSGTLIGSQPSEVSLQRYLRKWKLDWRKLLSSLLALCLPVLIPAIHIYIFHYLWSGTKSSVNRKNCDCSCWDGIFKGPYENGTPHYKHVYFNSDGTTFKMWLLTVLGVVSLYEVFKLLFSLLLTQQLRWSMALLFLSSLHSNYHSWWSFWNCWNDSYYRMWYSQLVFSMTALSSSLLVLRYVDLRRGIQPIPLLIVCSVALFHASCSAWDLGQGQLEQIPRDLTLMLTDIVYASLSINAIRNYAVMKGVSLLSLLSCRRHLAVLLLVNVVIYISLLVSPQLESKPSDDENEIENQQISNSELALTYGRFEQD